MGSVLRFGGAATACQPYALSDIYMMDDTIATKVIVLVLLGLIKLGSGLLPLLLDKVLKAKRVKWLEKFMSSILCIGGGVLLATVFIHMIPEVRENLETARMMRLKENQMMTTNSPISHNPMMPEEDHIHEHDHHNHDHMEDHMDHDTHDHEDHEHEDHEHEEHVQDHEDHDHEDHDHEDHDHEDHGHDDHEQEDHDHE